MAAMMQQRIALECAENIAILRLLHQVPAQPSINSTNTIQFGDIGYSIPFGEEQRLVSTLAFLAHMDDDSDHIPALCIQEVRRRRSLNILLAVNRAYAEDGRNYLLKIKAIIEHVATKLRDADGPPHKIEQDIFDSIVRLCQRRILCRLRFATKKGTTIIDGLQPAIEWLSRNSSKDSKSFLVEAQKVLKLAFSWRNHQTTQRLGELVESINSLQQINGLKETILDFIPERAIQIGVRVHLLNMIRKVSRYREAAKLLVRIARKFPVVRKMQVVVVELPGGTFSRPTIEHDEGPVMRSALARIRNQNGSANDVKRICALLKLSTEVADTQFNEYMNSATKNSKIHAEIQLLYYYHTIQDVEVPPPRVICSSKSACWLCNAFFLFHGKVHMPRSHGRLYPAWRLPNLHGDWYSDAATGFNRHLEDLVAQSLTTLYHRRAMTKYPYPRESEVSTIVWPPESLNSVKLSASVTSSEKPDDLEVVLGGSNPKPLELITPGSQNGPVPEKEILIRSPVAESTEISAKPRSESPSSSVVSHSLRHASASSKMSVTLEGTRDDANSYSVAIGEISSVYQLGPLRLQFEYASRGEEQALRGGTPKQLLCTAEWLSQQDYQQLGPDTGTAIDTKSLTGEDIFHKTDAVNNIYLRLEDAILKLTIQPVPRASNTPR